MANPIIMQLKMQCSLAKKEYQEHELKAIRLINELSGLVNPWFENDPETIKADEIEQIGDELKVVKEKLVVLKSRIKGIEKELGY